MGTKGRRKGERAQSFWDQEYSFNLSYKTLLDYVYFDSPEVINKSMAS